MKGQSNVPGRRYNDPPSSEWEYPYQQQIDAMALLADDDMDRLKKSTHDIAASMAGVFQALTTARGLSAMSFRAEN